MEVDDLGSFLRSRRAALAPEHAGVTAGERRRVPGLRREELAHLAGVSLSYYVRLEQGVCASASEGVLDALARALRLDGDAREHLFRLARPAGAVGGGQHALSPELRSLLDAMPGVPAAAIGPRMEILGWNELGHQLLAGHLDTDAPGHPATRPNMARMVFCDPHTCELFEDLDEKRREAVAYLRTSAGHDRGDPILQALVGELSVISEPFADLWAQAPVGEKTSGVRRFAHPIVGRVALPWQALTVPGGSRALLVTFLAEPGSSAAAAIGLLAG